MIDNRDRNNSLSTISARLMAVVLCLCLLFTNIPVAFADFASDGTQTFTASVTIPSFVDNDYDRMDDGWEIQYDLDPNDNPEDALFDNDNDGFTNLDEYRLGGDSGNFDDWNPTQSNSLIDVVILVAPSTTGTQPYTAQLIADVRDNRSARAVVKYEWDFDGNGTYDYSTRDIGVEYKFTAPGQHNIKVKAINSKGDMGIASETIEVIADTSTSPEVTGEIIGAGAVVNLLTPSIVRFNGSATDNSARGIAKYEWDLTGNGEYDFMSKKSAAVSNKYKETRFRAFYPRLKATNQDGLSDIDPIDTGVMIDKNKWFRTDDKNLRPVIQFEANRYVIHANANQQINFRGTALPYGRLMTDRDAFGWVRKLEWDFESDGIIDWVIEENSPEWANTIGAGEKTNARHIYGEPGVYKAAMRATSTSGPTIATGIDITAEDYIIIIVEEANNPPRAVAKCDYNTISGAVKIENGIIPLEVTFIAEDSTANTRIKKIEWDFNGDKIFDWSSDNKDERVTYTYTSPGYYLAALKVTAANNLSHTDYIPIFVKAPEGYYASIITGPSADQIIAGNAVTLTAEVFPDDAEVNKVMFEYSIDGFAWDEIGEGEPVSSYAVRWDTTAVPDRDYYIRAKVNDTESAEFIPVSVSVGNTLPLNGVDVYENIAGSTVSKQVKLQKGQANHIVFSDGTSITIPASAIPDVADDIFLYIDNYSVTAEGKIDINLLGNFDLLGDVIISIPYPDDNNDGRVDTTGVDENQLFMKWRNDAGTWEPIFDSVVYTEDNIVVAKVNHFSFFGLGVGGAIASIFGGGSSFGESVASYCFIATAAYGCADTEDVIILREFRDRFLLTNSLGEKFVHYYYKYSPDIAKYIKDKPMLKNITRLVLKPLVKFAKWKLNVGATFMAPSFRERSDTLSGTGKSDPYNGSVRGE